MTSFIATPQHAGLVADLLIAFNDEFDIPTPPRADLERRFTAMLDQPEVLVLVSGDSRTPLGLALTTLRPTPYFDGPIAVLDELYIVESERGSGLGSELLRRLEDELGQRDCGELLINIDEEDEDSRRFYDAHGYLNKEPGSDSRMLCYLKEL